jgi:4a-hydroxytetrahydrobiopterin dehydratase
MKYGFSKRKCIPCEDDSIKKLEKKFCEEYLEELSGWTLKENPDSLYKRFTFPDFKQALLFTNEIGGVAELEQHHPDILLSYGSVSVTLFTHNIGGLSINDFILASKIDGVYEGQHKI